MAAIEIIFLGDVYLGDAPSIELDAPVLEILGKADLVVANQEGPITRATAFNPNKCCLRSGVESAERLRRWGIDVVSLANNHMFDYGWEGFEETRRRLAEVGIRWFGAGADLGEAMHPRVIELGGVRIGLLGYSWALVQTTCATEKTFGCAPLDEELMVRQIHELKGQVDAVIVQPHWGYCEYRFLPPVQVSLADRLIEAGATAVIGHHSHVVQGSLSRGSRLIAYSLGNFAFAEFQDRGKPVKMSQDDREGVILRLRIGSEGFTTHEFIPTVLGHGDVVRLDCTPRRKTELIRLSAPLGASDYSRHWRRYVCVCACCAGCSTGRMCSTGATFTGRHSRAPG